MILDIKYKKKHIVAKGRKGCGWLASRRDSKYKKTHHRKGCGWLTSRR